MTYELIFAFVLNVMSVSESISPPDVFVIPQKQVCSEAMLSSSCRVMGFYKALHNGKALRGVIKISDSIPMPELRDSIIAHEMVHHVQRATNRIDLADKCEDRSLEEAEAYIVQNQFLRYAGSPLSIPIPEIESCI